MNFIDEKFNKIITEFEVLPVHELRSKMILFYKSLPINIKMSLENFLKNYNFWGELEEKSVRACKGQNICKLVVAGGVGANSRLKERLSKACEENNIEFFAPNLKFCTDNAGMIGSMAYYLLKDGLGLADLSLTAKANVDL